MNEKSSDAQEPEIFRAMIQDRNEWVRIRRQKGLSSQRVFLHTGQNCSS